MPRCFQADRRRRARPVPAALAAFGAVLTVPAAADAAPKVVPMAVGQGKARPGHFIVTLAERVDPRTVARDHGVVPEFVYERVLTGFSGSIAEAARSGLLRDRRVVRIEQDREARITQLPWGLDRIDQRTPQLDGRFVPNGAGRAVSAYIVDTGIRTDHQEFAGRASIGFDAVGDGRNGSDCNGHGTHVAGTVGGRVSGVAKEVALVSIRVLGCDGSGTMSGVIAGLDWIAANARRPAVVNISLGGGGVAAVDDAVRRLAGSGIPVVVAAGNEGADACAGSPARTPEAITVAASDRNDQRPAWSNYGVCVDLFAPGDSILSAWFSAIDAAAISSGTSMAAPHAAGFAALLLEQSPARSAADIQAAMIDLATPAIVTNAQSQRNHLLFAQISAPGVASGTPANDTLTGTPGADRISGEGGDDLILLQHGGDDIALGGDGNDAFIFGPALTAQDQVDGGAGKDQLGLQGAYTLTFGDRNLTGIETLTLLSGSDTRFGDPGTSLYDYAVRTVDANVAPGASLTVNLNGLKAGEDVTFDGSAETDGSFFFYGGAGMDSLTGGANGDSFFFGAGLFSAIDRVVGGAGLQRDQLGLRGSYSLVFEAETMKGIETIALVSGKDTRFGSTGPDYSYALATHDSNLAAGQQLSVNAADLVGAEALRFDGSAETDGTFRIVSGKGDDTLVGGSGADILYGGLGSDALQGREGADAFFYRAAAESTGSAHDTIVGFDAAADRLDLPVGGHRLAGRASGGRLDMLTFDVDLAEAVETILVKAGDAALFVPATGSFASRTFLVLDSNGLPGYQAGADYVIELKDSISLPKDGAIGFTF